ncbi:MAG: hypothetical protein AAB495_02600 [Patescibacteria group bacterium]
MKIARLLCVVAALLSVATESFGASSGRSPEFFGYNNNLSISSRQGITAEAAMLGAKGGMKWSRYTLYWNRVNPEPGVYDWSQVDQQLQVTYDAGGVVYVNLKWAPAHAAEGRNTYLPFYCMKLDGSEPDGFDRSKPDCTDPAPLDSAKLRTVIREFLTSHVLDVKAGRIAAFGCFNEPADQIYWPPGSPQELVDRVLRPCAEEVRKFRKENRISAAKLPIVGPEEIDPANLERIFKLEEAGKISLFDVVSFHLYHGPKGMEYPVGPLTFYDHRYRPLIERYGANRPVWITETGAKPLGETFADLRDQGVRLVSMLSELEARRTFVVKSGGKNITRRGVEKIFIYKLVAGSCPGSEYTLLDCTGKVKPSYRQVKAFILGK